MGNKVAVARMEAHSGTFPPPGTPERENPIATGQGVYNVVRRSGKGEETGPKWTI
jgi:acyl-coenzyme A thioesterase PaaI-like protein